MTSRFNFELKDCGLSTQWIYDMIINYSSTKNTDYDTAYNLCFFKKVQQSGLDMAKFKIVENFKSQNP